MAINSNKDKFNRNMKIEPHQNGSALADFLSFCFVVTVAYCVAGLLIQEVPMASIALPILSLCAVLTLLTVPTIQLIMKLGDVGQHDSLSSQEHVRLGEIVRAKSKRLKRYLLYIIITAVLVVISSILARTDGVIAKHFLTFTIINFSVCVYLIIYIFRGIGEIRDFKWELNQKAIDLKKRKEVLDRLNKTD